jgi:hypothetical protein
VDSKEAKEILGLYRPGTADEDDGDFAEALVLAKQDLELSRWFEEHCAIREAVRAKFQQISPPEGLKEQILSERKAHTSLGVQRKAVLLAVLATTILFLIGIASLYLRPREEDNSLPAFRNRVAGDVLRSYPTMDLETDDLVQIRQNLAQHGGHGDYELSKGLARASATGCKSMSWHGKPVSMVCFNSAKNSAAKTPDLFLFVIDRSALSNPPPSNSPEFARISDLTTAAWTSGNKTYILGGLGNEEFLRKFL